MDIIRIFRSLYRLIVITALVSTFLVCSFVLNFAVRERFARLRAFSRNASRFSGYILWVLNVDVRVINKPSSDEKFLLVSNHMGFLDILMLAHTTPSIFVTSNEMRETPFLGLLTEMGGCMFVERRSRTRILEEMQSMAEVLRDGSRVALYPEATSTNGEQVLPFKRTLLMAAAYGEVPIQPVVINFRKINGEDFNLKWRDSVCWYGDMSFVTTGWRLLGLDSVLGEVEFLEKIYPKVEDDRGLVADRAHALIAAKFQPVRGTGEALTKSLDCAPEVCK